ncbi:hypothetical protein LCGC14_1020750 [marine sediment metagenome]|uniref:Uncharacterized protein n=1 Tax=marine sediment metagenome TaxID=412755 RepID=A0A0F9NJ33_9ZZZZ
MDKLKSQIYTMNRMIASLLRTQKEFNELRKVVLSVPPKTSGYRKVELLKILRLRKTREYRKGIIQCAVTFGIIDNSEWRQLFDEVSKGAPLSDL